MPIYTKDDELPDDIANEGDELIPVATLPGEHKAQLESWGYDVAEVEKREADATS
jgi:hypothetical protein